ncbi:MAG TPA: ABC transporter permease [Candidatus Dojkabacteria bacterium]|nr:ABC transporter permease [Candidatus Dojkabacteria bacterium]
MSKLGDVKRQLRSILVITKASIVSLLRSPASLVFGLIFPIIFISIFGLLDGGNSNINIYLTKNSDKNNPIYQTFSKIDHVKFVDYDSDEAATKDLSRGKFDGMLDIEVVTVNNKPQYQVKLSTSASSQSNSLILSSIIQGVVSNINLSVISPADRISTFTQEQVAGRQYKQIDFILPGQLGFSLLNSGIFGTAFILLSLKETLVLKRFFATPIKRINILIAEGLSRLIYSTLQTTILVGAGYFMFSFTLINGFWTFFAIMMLCILGLIVFLGMGFLVSALAKNQNGISTIANIFTLPQFLLTGTFFPLDLLPKWLQFIGNGLPLTHLNSAMRLVAFEGASFSALVPDILWLIGWAIAVYVIALKLFKWDD